MLGPWRERGDIENSIREKLGTSTWNITVQWAGMLFSPVDQIETALRSANRTTTAMESVITRGRTSVWYAIQIKSWIKKNKVQSFHNKDVPADK